MTSILDIDTDLILHVLSRVCLCNLLLLLFMVICLLMFTLSSYNVGNC